MAIQTQTKLESLVEGFDRDTAGSRSRISELLEREPRSFQSGVVRVLKAPSSSRGLQYVVSLVVASDFLMATLCDPALTLEEAVGLARTALQMDPMTDVNLARKLADDSSLGSPLPNAGRLMDVLGEISAGSRITSSLMRLLRNSDPELRSKAVLLIGRSSRSIKWLQNRMAEADPRTRANAVEALWGVDTVEAKELLRTAVMDSNNRVAGNAVFALHCIGDTLSIPELLKMAASDSPLFRASAAWAMGETGDPRFSETLARMLGETNAIVRKRAFSALSHLKAVANRIRQAPEWRLAGRMLPGAGGVRQFRLDVGAKDGAAPPRLLATQFILTEDGQPVTHYQVETRGQIETLAVTFLFPHITDIGNPLWVQGALHGLPRKRPSDLWCATFYLPANEAPLPSMNPPSFTADRETATGWLEKPGAKMDCAPFWDCVRNSVHAANAPTRGARHLILYNQDNPERPSNMPEIVSAAITSHTTVHVISTRPNAPLEELARRTQGSFEMPQSVDEISKLVEETHLMLLARFSVSYQPSPGALTLNVRVNDAAGWGETSISLASQ